MSMDEVFIHYWKSAFDSKPKTTICLFDRGEWLVCAESDADLVANSILGSPSLLKTWSDPDLPFSWCNISRNRLEMVLKELLLVKQYRVELYQNLGTKTGEKQQWELLGKASPGNLAEFEDLMFSGEEVSNCVADIVTTMALKLYTDDRGQTMVGLALADTTRGRFTVAEFGDKGGFANLETALVQLSPKECLVLPGNADLLAEAGKILTRSGVVFEQKRPDLSSLEQDLNSVLKFEKGQMPSCATLPEWSLKNAMACVSVLIRHLDLLNSKDAAGRFRFKPYVSDCFMRLNSASLTALNVFDGGASTLRSRAFAQEYSLFSVLNHCRTAQGERLLAQWLKQPLIDPQLISERLDIVEAFVNFSLFRDRLSQEALRKFPDLARLTKRFLRKTATLQDCYTLYESVQRLTEIEKCLKDLAQSCPAKTRGVVETLLINPLVTSQQDFARFQEMLESTIDFSTVSTMEFLVKPDFDENLTSLRSQIDDLQASIEAQLPKVARILGLEPGKSVKLEKAAQIGYCFRITRKEEHILRKNKTFEVIDAQKGGVRFTNSTVRKFNEDYLECKANYEETQDNIVTEIVAVASSYLEPLNRLADIIGTIDVVVSLSVAAVSAPIPFCRPEILPKDQGVVKMTAGRHPCLESREEIDFIPNDLEMRKDESHFLIITGPNMGGKSTFIRQTGVVILMAQIGSFVPCKSATISVRDAVYARVGASDCVQKGVSTFMAEMLETSAIINSSTEDSLIVIDELGRGTSTYDGFGLAWAISKYIASEMKAFCLFATHFHELTTLASSIPGVVNMHVSALTDQNTFTLLYKVEPGCCDESFGVHIAEMVRLPEEVVKMAKNRVSALDFLSKVGSATDQEACRKTISEIVLEMKAQHASGASLEELKELFLKKRAELACSDNSVTKQLVSGMV